MYVVCVCMYVVCGMCERDCHLPGVDRRMWEVFSLSQITYSHTHSLFSPTGGYCGFMARAVLSVSVICTWNNRGCLSTIDKNVLVVTWKICRTILMCPTYLYQDTNPSFETLLRFCFFPDLLPICQESDCFLIFMP